MKRVSVRDVQICAFSDMNNLIDNARPSVFISIGGEAIVNNFSSLSEYSRMYTPYADGELAVCTLKKAGFQDVEKIAGVSLWQKFLSRHNDLKVVAIGGSEDVITEFRTQFSEYYPRHQLAFSRSGYFDDSELNFLVEKIVSLKPNVVLLGMGQPLQEKIAHIFFCKHPAYYFCLGGSFDVFVGKVKRAPHLLIALKLEWFYRLVRQPTRLSRIYKLPFFYIKLILGFEKVRLIK